jgi:hypothetical protein
MLPKSPRQLLLDLEAIKFFMNKTSIEKAKASAKDSADLASAKSSPPKRVYMGLNEQVPKKAHTAKFCQHCKMNGGPYMTHNTKECHKYNKDGKTVAAAAKKPFEKKPHKKYGGGDDKQMAHLTDIIKSLVKRGLNSLTPTGADMRPTF